MLKNYFEVSKYDELKESNDLIYKALEISSELFKHDTDKGGLPYMLHLFYVYRHVYTKEEKVIALLHDIMEDKDVSKKDLLEIGFSNKIVDDINILTRKKDMDYKAYIDKIVREASKEALEVKLADLKNNIDLTRIKNPTVKDYERVEKRYMPSYEKILNRLKEITK